MAITRTEFPLVQSGSFSDLYTGLFRDNRASAVEEALANANVHRRIRPFYSKSFRSTPSFSSGWQKLNALMRRQPGPYSRFESVSKNHDFSQARDFLVDRAFIPIWSSSPVCSEVMSSRIWFADFETGVSSCPIYFIDDVPSVKVIFSKPFEKWNGIQVFVYPKDHKPPHIHAVDLKTREERRFEWPSLTPLAQDQRIPRPTERAVKDYARTYWTQISNKVAQVPWQ